MADKYINETGLQTIKTWIKSTFGLKSDLETLTDRVDDIVAEGGEPNVIETVKVNGTALTPDAQKAVDVEAATLTKASNPAGPTGIENTYTVTQGETDVAFNYIKQDGSGDVPNYLNARLDSDAFMLATTNYVDANGGKIDVIEVNGTAQTITNKTVNIPVPTATSDLTNDSGFQTEAEVQALIDAELADITGIDFQVVQTLPATGEHGVIYLVSKTGTAGDIYDEYIWVTPTSGTAHFEQIGTTDIDLSDYWSKTELTAMTVSEINAILNA